MTFLLTGTSGELAGDFIGGACFSGGEDIDLSASGFRFFVIDHYFGQIKLDGVRLTGMSTRFFTNAGENTLLAKFRSIFEHNLDKDADEDIGAPGDVAAPDVSKEWYSRGYLPHRHARSLIQSLTFRLADSLPKTLLERLEEELNLLPPTQMDVERRKRIEAWLDSGMGCCALRHPEAAECVQNSLKHFHGQRYQLHAWCIMPNHVHVMIEPLSDLA